MKFIITEEQSEKLNHKVKTMVNKLGLDDTIKLFDGSFDVIKRAYSDNPSEFLDQFNNLKPVQSKRENLTHYKDKKGKTLIYYLNDEITDAGVDYDRIYKFFLKILGLHPNEIQEILKNWLEKTYNVVLKYNKSYNEMKPSAFNDKILSSISRSVKRK